MLVAGPKADVASDVENGVDVFGHGALKRGFVLDLPFHQADGIVLQMRQPRAGTMQSHHVPARLRELLDEVEADEAGATCDEGGFVRHDFASSVFAATIKWRFI